MNTTSALDWTRTYPCLAAVMTANLDTLITWNERLPAPQTDVEHTVRRRLKVRLELVVREQLRKEAPHVADLYEDLLRRLANIGIKVPL